jgi:hypothetical protein
MIGRVSLDRCFDQVLWKRFNFFALVQPDNDILPVRTVYDGVTQNIGKAYSSQNGSPGLMAFPHRCKRAQNRANRCWRGPTKE